MSNNDSGMSLPIIALMIYLFISQIMACYFWWQWAQDHSFLSSAFIGPIVGEFKGLLWIFFIW